MQSKTFLHDVHCCSILLADKFWIASGSVICRDSMLQPKMDLDISSRSELSFCVIFRLHRMHELLTIVIDVRGVCQSVARLELGAAHAVYAMSCVRGVIWCSIRKCLWPLVLFQVHRCRVIKLHQMHEKQLLLSTVAENVSLSVMCLQLVSLCKNG